MPTLLEKSAPVASSTLPSEVLRSRHRWEKWRGALIALVVGLAVTFAALLVVHHSWHTPENWKLVAIIWISGVSATLVAAIGARLLRPASLLETAQKVDRHLDAKNRLEASVTLHESLSPLALAQREEAASYLKSEPRVRPLRALSWLVGGLMLLVLVHLVTLGTWVLPSLLHPETPTPPKPPPVAVLPQATIIWKSPEPESKANPIEEVPTVAVAQSTTGLKNLSLEISVNGLPKKSIPLPAQPYDKAGKNMLKSSIYMDELDAQPFDVVSYFIRAQRITDQKVPDTTSAIQFIQVRPFRDDVTQVRGADGGNPRYALLIRLKLAQLRSIKENFVLAHTDVPATNPIRMKENDRVGKNQGELSAKTEEVVQAFIEAGYDADMIDLLRQAEAPMDDASKKILATQNVEALPSQEKALGLIVEVEKFFIKIMADKGSGPPDSNPDDPFKDKQKHELKKRMDAASGQLEALAKNQTKLAQDINHGESKDEANPTPSTPTDASPSSAGPPGNQGQPPAPAAPAANPADKSVPLPPAQAVDPTGPDADKGTFAERQTRVAQGIDALLNTNEVLPPAATDALQQARKDAGDSMHQLNQGDEASAREPAAKAAQDLQQAVAEMNKAGDRDTRLAMEDAQQRLNDLAHQMDDLAKNGSPDAAQKLNDLAQQVNDLRQQLQDAADKQQESGSAQGAQHLEQLAQALADQKMASQLADMSKTGLDAAKLAADAQKLEELAGVAAHGQAADTGKPSAQDLARLVNDLEASRANLARLAEKARAGTPGMPGNANSPTPNQPGQNPATGTQGTQGSGQKPGDTPQPSSESGQGQKPGQPQGQGQQPGKDAGAGQNGEAPNGSGGSETNSQPQRAAQVSTASGITPNVQGPMTGSAQAYREVIDNLKDEAQRVDATIPDNNTGALMQAVIHADQDTSYRPASAVNIVHGYEAIAAPLDKLILDLEQAAAHAQRQEVVKQPNLDDAPPPYRQAVSDYFETMSRDYHPDGSDQDAKKP
jgi:multisubunit Na+/H+ antiporter MnhB subunit